MKTNKFSILMIFAFVLYASESFAIETPTALTCKSNAKANRDFLFKSIGSDQEGWKGSPFNIGATDKESSLVLRNKVFANLDSDSPTIRSITDDKGEEFIGKVISRAEDAVFLIWNNDPFGNKLWSAAIDLVNKKAVVSQVYKGMTSTGIDSETLDCS